MRIGLGVLVVVLSGCGAPQYGGIWGGLVDQLISCGDGSTNNDTATLSWAITDNDDWTITITTGGSCDPLTADVDRDKATLRRKDCGLGTFSDGTPVDRSQHDGSLTPEGKGLRLSTNIFTETNTAKYGSCNWNYSGLMFK